MGVERDIVIEREQDDQSAADRTSAYTTFIGAASTMPRFTDDELNRGKEKIRKALEEIGAESVEPVDPFEPNDDTDPPSDDQ